MIMSRKADKEKKRTEKVRESKGRKVERKQRKIIKKRI